MWQAVEVLWPATACVRVLQAPRRAHATRWHRQTGRPRHEKADPEEQEAFKKTSRTPSVEAESAIVGSR